MCHGLIRLLRLPVAEVDERGDRRGVGKGEHVRIVLPEQSPVHHGGKELREHVRQPREKMLRREGSRAVVAILLDGEELARHDDLLIVNREVRHAHRHLHERLRRLRHRRQMLGRAEARVVIGDHLVEQGVPDGLLALKMPIERGFAHAERRRELSDVRAGIAVLREQLQRRREDFFFCVFRHNAPPGKSDRSFAFSV